MRRWGLVLLVLVGVVALSASVLRTAMDTNEQTVFSNVEEYRVLILGEDNAAGLTDVMMLASFDLNTPSLSVMQIPRDTYLAYTSADYKKINGAAHALGGEKVLCDFLGQTLGVPIDAYVSFDLAFVEDAVDMLGGVEMDVPFDMDYDDPYQDLSIHLKAGRQILSGKEASHFIRYRSGYLRGDLGRMDAQKLFLAALVQSFLQNGGGGDLLGVAMIAAKYLKTNMPVNTMVALAGVMRRVSPENMTFLTLPGEEVQSEYSGAWYYILSKDGMRTVISRFFGADENAFDLGGCFTDKNRRAFREIYEKNISPEAYTAKELLGGKLQIENQ